KKLMSIQRRISKKKNRALVGQELDVLVEGVSEDSELVMMGRHAGQAPEIDGCVYLSGGTALPGEFRRVRITQASDYDLVGELHEDSTGEELPPAPIAISHRASDGRRVLRTYR
ncbi:MAG TPA: TRAM domain-containing protein, partial [Polyangiaceae bacterium]|nr:TRAM domain-containing protein [Polyangiaceae bacterium]